MSKDRSPRRRPAPQASTAKRRGRAFEKGPDPRRNTSGRRAKAVRSPSEEMLAAIMTPAPVRENGKRRKKPKLRVIMDRNLHDSMHGDQAAARVVATLIRATALLVSQPQDRKNAPLSTVHNEKILRKLLQDYERRIIQGATKSKKGGGE